MAVVFIPYQFHILIIEGIQYFIPKLSVVNLRNCFQSLFVVFKNSKKEILK